MDLLTPAAPVSFTRGYKIRMTDITIPNRGPLLSRYVSVSVEAIEVIDGVVSEVAVYSLGQWLIPLAEVATVRFPRSGPGLPVAFAADTVSPLELATDLESILTSLWPAEAERRIAAGSLDPKYRVV
jgi:hypothetical protein